MPSANNTRVTWRRLVDICWLEFVALAAGACLTGVGLWLDVRQHASGGSGHSMLPVLGCTGVLAAAISLVARSGGWDPQIPPLSAFTASVREREHRLSSVVQSGKGLLADALIALAIGALVAGCAYAGTRAIPAAVYEVRTLSVWFESDLSDFMHAMVDRFRDVGTNIHPWYFVVGYCFVHAIHTLTGLSILDATHVFAACQAGVWAFVFYIVLRTICAHRLDAIVFCALGLSSAASIFWLTVPESYIGGSLTILLSLLAIVIAQRTRLPESVYVGLNALTLGFTVTNWMAGIVATVLNHSVRRTAQIVINGFALGVLLWMAAHIVFPSGPFLFSVGATQTRYLYTSLSDGPFAVLTAFLFHGMVMPELQLTDRFSNLLGNWPILVTQYSPPGSGPQPWGTMAVLVWTALLVFGVWALLRVREHPKLRIAVGLLLLAQLLLHIVYGEETFLYSIHYVPLLVILTALATRTRLRPWVLSLAVALATTAAINNTLQFTRATTAIACLERQDLRDTAERQARAPIDKQAFVHACVSTVHTSRQKNLGK